MRGGGGLLRAAVQMRVFMFRFLPVLLQHGIARYIRHPPSVRAHGNNSEIQVQPLGSETQVQSLGYSPYPLGDPILSLTIGLWFAYGCLDLGLTRLKASLGASWGPLGPSAASSGLPGPPGASSGASRGLGPPGASWLHHFGPRMTRKCCV